MVEEAIEIGKSENSNSDAAPKVKSGEPRTPKVTAATVRRLERAGSWESARIAREYLKPAT